MITCRDTLYKILDRPFTNNVRHGETAALGPEIDLILHRPYRHTGRDDSK